jgi:hypothetical protein
MKRFQRTLLGCNGCGGGISQVMALSLDVRHDAFGDIGCDAFAGVPHSAEATASVPALMLTDGRSSDAAVREFDRMPRCLTSFHLHL